jgi:hypothetical protein
MSIKDEQGVNNGCASMVFVILISFVIFALLADVRDGDDHPKKAECPACMCRCGESK